MSKKICVAVFFGGVSVEHEVSRMSCKFVLENLDREKYDVLKIGITKKGDFFLYDGTVESIVDGTWESNPYNKPIFISLNRSERGIALNRAGDLQVIPIDVAFPVLHGENGEDGTIQGTFELAGIPYVGCNVLSSAMCMDKITTNTLLKTFGIRKAKFVPFSAKQFKDDYLSTIGKIEYEINSYPLFVKPSNAGSSVGISRIFAGEELKEAVEKAIKVDSRILVEEAIFGKEVECAVLGNDDPVVSAVGEIIPSNDFYDYDAKYLNGSSKTIVPADINEEISEEIRKTALKAYKIMGCSGLSRIDFFVEHDTHKVFLNEINTIPGLTPISMYPKLFEYVGVSNQELIDKLISLAIERSKNNG